MDLQPKNEKKLRITTEFKGEDRISVLTDDVIHQILKFVDTKLAVQTCILSKRWKLVWTTLPYLNFKWDEQGSAKSTTNFTRHVLNHRNHQSQISSLELKHLPAGLNDKFIEYAILHHVQHLSVHFRRKHKPYKLYNFSSSSIRSLELRMRLEDLASESDCWDLPSLTTLNLRHLHTGHVYQILPVRCLTSLPALRTLHLSFWNFRESAIYLSLPDLTALYLDTCKMPDKVWNLPALKTLRLEDVKFPGNTSDTLAAFVSLQNLTLDMAYAHEDFFITCPELINLEIKTSLSYCDTDTIEGNIMVLSPKLSNFTSVGFFPITFGASNLDNVYLKLRGWLNYTNSSRNKLKVYFRRITHMLSGLGSAKILHLELETIRALSLIADILASSPSPFCNLKCVMLPHGFKEENLSGSLRSYLFGGSPTATILTTTRQNMIPCTPAASMTAVDNDMVVNDGIPVEGTHNDQVSSSRENIHLWLWQGNEIDSKFEGLLNQIMNKYPETFEHLATKNKKFCTMKLNMLCTAVNDFIKIPVTEVDPEIIGEYRDVFADLQKLGFNVSWLVTRLINIEQLRFSQSPLPKLHAVDCHNDDGQSQLQDLQIRIDDAKIKLQGLQTLRAKKMQQLQKAFGTMDANPAVGYVGDNLFDP